MTSLHCKYCHLKLGSSLSGGLIYLLDLYCNGTNPTVRERSAELFSKMMSDKLIGPKVKIVLAKFLPAIFMDAMRDNAEASVHMFEGELYKAKFSSEGGSVLPQSDYSLETRPFMAKSFNLAGFASNTTRIVSSDMQTLRSNISNTKRSVSSDIQTLEVIYQTQDGVIHLISNHREVIYQTREGVFHLISKH